MNARLPAGHVRVLDPFSPEGIREAVAKILEGHNYRLIFEDVTKRRLIATYRNWPNTRWTMKQTTKSGKKQSEMNLQRAEVRTNRGTVRIDIGMIGEGNPEVIDDKISRVGRNGVVLFDKLSPNSNAWANGERQQVKMIQMRNSNPVEELRSHLSRLGVEVTDKIPHREIADRVLAMDSSQFDFRK